MKDRYCKKSWSSVRLFEKAILTCILIAQVMIPQTASAEVNKFYPEQITVTQGYNSILEVPDQVVWLTGGGCNTMEERTDIDAYPIAAVSASTFSLEV